MGDVRYRVWSPRDRVAEFGVIFTTVLVMIDDVDE
jgi:hypothetical protein